MLTCWDSEVERRPVFADLVQTLCSQLLAMADYMQFNTVQSTEVLSTEAQSTEVDTITVATKPF